MKDHIIRLLDEKANELAETARQATSLRWRDILSGRQEGIVIAMEILKGNFPEWIFSNIGGEPPDGTKVTDHEGVLWHRVEGDWCRQGSPDCGDWNWLLRERGPLKMVP